ncbi:unnamed protein product [Pleuronectes platessa]|uniref:Uncharacterized protein n=1 Tax=Pleuronectes platessa TaxID=8262 RepID=A0A9N7YC44_PLEPL|nr:unnamed protein product [Pleuronectes platessa]
MLMLIPCLNKNRILDGPKCEPRRERGGGKRRRESGRCPGSRADSSTAAQGQSKESRADGTLAAQEPGARAQVDGRRPSSEAREEGTVGAQGQRKRAQISAPDMQQDLESQPEQGPGWTQDAEV